MHLSDKERAILKKVSQSPNLGEGARIMGWTMLICASVIVLLRCNLYVSEGGEWGDMFDIPFSFAMCAAYCFELHHRSVRDRLINVLWTELQNGSTNGRSNVMR
jgi:hypothetical protein